MRLGKLVALAGVLVACSSTTPSSPSGQDGATVSGGTVGSGGAKSAGGATSNGAPAQMAGHGKRRGDSNGRCGWLWRREQLWRYGSNGGVTGTGGGKGDAAADLRSDLAVGSGGASNTGGTAGGNGGSGTGGAGNGGASGTLADGGRDSGSGAKPDLLSDATKDGVASTDGFTKPVAVPDGGTCPYTGSCHLQAHQIGQSDRQPSRPPTRRSRQPWTKPSPTTNCYTNITKADNVVYDPSVETADGNSNGTIHFGSNTTYMVLPTAMHEISHTVGIGQAANWHSFVAMTDAGSGPWTGANGIAQRRPSCRTTTTTNKF